MSNQTTIKNRTIFCGDNLDILQGFNDNSVDLIYLDPPFNKKKQFVAPIGSDAEGAEFKDYWEMKDIKDSWIVLLKEKNPDLYHFLELSGKIGDKSNKYYLVYMAVRLLEMKRILKDTGSIYLHCDNTMGHYLKLLMDVIFGHNNFRNEIVWHYRRWTAKSNGFQKLHDVIFFYSGSADFFFKQLYTPYTEGSLKRKKQGVLNRFKDGETVLISNKSVDELGVRENDVWQIPYIAPSSKERIGYPTQKPLALLERIIEASCPEGGIVLDPFCGCATTCVAAEKLGREWIGIDISKKAYELVNIRLHKEIANPEDLFQHKNALIFRDDIPERTDIESIKLIGKAKKEVKETLYGKQHGNCAGCKQHFNLVHMEIDHIIPQAKGGADSKENFQLLCSYCNRVKGDRPMAELLAKLEYVRSMK